MRHLNYNHLHYFWVVATTGSIAKAAESLHVTPQTISGQLRTLENRLGSALFRRIGRKLALTEAGRTVRSYVDPMFDLGRELGEALERRTPQRSSPLAVGVASGVGSLIASRIVGPALSSPATARVLCHEAPRDSLVAALRARHVDLVVTDDPVAATEAAAVRSHLVGQCGVTVYCAAAHAERYKSRFPHSLDGAPFIMPARTSSLAKSLADWFRRQRVAPRIVAEIESPDLTAVVCERYAALFVSASATAHDVARRYDVSAIGEVASAEHNFFVVCAERPARPDGIAAIVTSAREQFRAAAAARDVALESWRAQRPMADKGAPRLAGPASAIRLVVE